MNKKFICQYCFGGITQKNKTTPYHCKMCGSIQHCDLCGLELFNIYYLDDYVICQNCHEKTLTVI